MTLDEFKELLLWCKDNQIYSINMEDDDLKFSVHMEVPITNPLSTSSDPLPSELKINSEFKSSAYEDSDLFYSVE